jgi:hypothetical protein
MYTSSPFPSVSIFLGLYLRSGDASSQLRVQGTMSKGNIGRRAPGVVLESMWWRSWFSRIKCAFSASSLRIWAKGGGSTTAYSNVNWPSTVCSFVTSSLPLLAV